MRRPNHERAKEIAEENECPECGSELCVNPDGAYIGCTGEGCNWLGWSYEHVGALTRYSEVGRHGDGPMNDTSTDVRDCLVGPRSAKNALSNAYHSVHRGDEEGAKWWIERAEDRIEDAVEAQSIDTKTDQ